MSFYYRTRGFILKKNNLREADQLFYVYGESFGKLEILARAIRKIKSKLRSGAELFYLSEIEFVQGKRYKTLTGAAAIEKFKNIRKSLEKFQSACRVAEALDLLTAEEDEDKAVFSLLEETFQKLNECRGGEFKYQTLYYFFLWNLFSRLGYQIDFYNCSVCRGKLRPGALYFNLDKNGIVCSFCSEKGERISPEIIKILRFFLEKDWKTVWKLKIRENSRKYLEFISEEYLCRLSETKKANIKRRFLL